MKKFAFFSIIFFTLSMFAKKQVVRIEKPSKEFISFCLTNNYDIALHSPDNYIDLVVDDKTLEKLHQENISFRITQTESQLQKNLNSTKDLTSYRNYEETLADLQAYEAMFPNICKLYEIGTSLGYQYAAEGNNYYHNFEHKIWALKISDNVQDEEDEPNIYYVAEHHAREPISLEVAMKVLEHIVSHYGADETITENVNESQIWFVPLLNPDGHKIVTTETDVWWRKNIRDNNQNGTFDTDFDSGYGVDGVDPNRNYSWEWSLVGASASWESPTYHGEYPFSEPEVASFKNLLDSHHFVAGISYHSYGELVLFPYGYADGVSGPDHQELQSLAIQMGESIPSYNTYSGHYTPEQAWELYPCSGTTDDYSYGEHGIFSYTIELATEFIPPANQVEEICENNIDAAMILLNRYNHSMLTGHISDSVSRNPIVADITINEIDDFGAYRKPYKSNEDFGTYYRFLPEGFYDVTYTAYGYLPVTIEDVEITDEAQTVVDVTMIPSDLYSIQGFINDGTNFDPIFGVNVELFYQSETEPISTTISDATGYYSLEGLPQGTYIIKCTHENYATYTETIELETNVTLSVSLYEAVTISFEDNELEDFSFDGMASWNLASNQVYHGSYSVQSGNINDLQETSILYEVDLLFGGEISFYKKVSSEQDYDFLTFYIDGIPMDQWSGELNWSVSSFNVSAGEHTFKWTYEKDTYVSDGEDCAWIDYIQLPVNSNGTEFLPPQNLTGYVNYNFPDNIMHINWEAPNETNATLDSYGIYRNYELIENVSSSTNNFSEVNPPEYNDDGYVHYYVIANYINPEGNSIPSNMVTLEFALDIGENELVYQTELKGNYPNPFNPTTSISFSLAQESMVELSIYNSKGQLVKKLLNDELGAGLHQIKWDGLDSNHNHVSTGLYFYQLQTENYKKMNKMILLK